MTTSVFAAGGYRFAPGVFQYSGAVAAEPGFAVERVTFQEPVPLAEGFDKAAAIMQATGRPLAALCACELRSPAPFDEAGFKAFNELYCRTLAEWGIVKDGVNPVARSNVCPEIDKPTEPSFHAFCFTVEAPGAGPSFAIAGSGEVPEGKDSYQDHVVSRGDTSAAGMRAKAQFVLDEMERRMGLLGFGWDDATAVQAYTVFDLHAVFASEIVARRAARQGVTWHYCRPPVVGLDFEMDCRAVAVEGRVV